MHGSSEPTENRPGAPSWPAMYGLRSGAPLGRRPPGRSAGDDEPRRGAPEWLVPYPDFITLPLAFFVMIVSVSDINLHDGRFDSMKSSLGRHFGAESSAGAAPASTVAPRNGPLAKWLNRTFEDRRHWLAADGEDSETGAAAKRT